MKQIVITRTNTIVAKLCFGIVLTFTACTTNETIKDPLQKIVVEIELSRDMVYQRPANYLLKDELEIDYSPVTQTDHLVITSSAKSKISHRKVKWEIYSAEPVQVNYGFGRVPLADPGDSIHIRYDGKKITYSGSGSAKMAAFHKLTTIAEQMEEPTMSNNAIKNIDEYLKWNVHVNQRITRQLETLDTYNKELSAFQFNFLKAYFANSAQSDLIQSFNMLWINLRKNPAIGYVASDLNSIWDSTQYKPWCTWLRSMPSYYGDSYNLCEFGKSEVMRKFNFDLGCDSLKSKENRSLLFYRHAKLSFTGLMRERILALLISDQVFKNLQQNNPVTQSILSDYYSQKGFPEYKLWIRQLADKRNKSEKAS